MRDSRISHDRANPPTDASVGGSSDSECVESPTLQAFVAESWFTPEGARLKARKLERAGIPDMSNWRFITLSVADRSVSPLTVYLRGKDRMRRFLSRVREAIGEFRWCWKLEFHDDDYPHWHLCLEYLQRIPEEMFAEWERWWGLGRINIKRINDRELYYVFKYVCKAADDLPPWVQNYKGRLRVFQTSRGFFTKRKKRVVKKQEPVSCMVKTTIGTRMSWESRRALLTTYIKGEKRVACVRLRMTFATLLLGRALEALRTGVPMAYSDRVSISQLQELELRHENRKYRTLAAIPRNAEFGESTPDWGPVSVRNGDLCPA